MRWRTMIAVYNLQRKPRLSAYYPVSPDQRPVVRSALGAQRKHKTFIQLQLRVTERQAGPHPSAPMRFAAARPEPRPRGLAERNTYDVKWPWRGYLRAPPWPAPTLRGCRGRGRAGGGSLPGPTPRPQTRPPRPQAAGWSSSGTRTNWKIKWETDGEDISHYTDRYLIRPSQSASAYVNISSISQSETLK